MMSTVLECSWCGQQLGVDWHTNVFYMFVYLYSQLSRTGQPTTYQTQALLFQLQHSVPMLHWSHQKQEIHQEYYEYHRNHWHTKHLWPPRLHGHPRCHGNPRHHLHSRHHEHPGRCGIPLILHARGRVSLKSKQSRAHTLAQSAESDFTLLHLRV